MTLCRRIKSFFRSGNKDIPSHPIAHEQPKRRTNLEGMNLIKVFEGFYPNAYKCPAGVWTIGYGTTVYPDGIPVKKGDKCNEAQAFHWLTYEVMDKEAKIQAFLEERGVMLNSNQFSALVSFCYNLGLGPLVQSSRSLHQAILTRNSDEICDAMKLYVKANGKTLRGLARRREAEVKLFKTPIFDTE